MQRGNVTVEGYAYATPVADAQIDEVIDLDDGTVVSASALIGGQLYQNFIEDRVTIVERMNSDRPRFLCGMCEAPVYFVSTPDKRFFLRHRAKDEDSWEEHIVPFSSLTQDRDGQRTFLFDHAAADHALRAQIEKEQADWEANQVWIDQQDFFEFWTKHARGFKHTSENRAVWVALRRRFIARGVVLSDYPDSDGEMRAMLNAIYSAREGAPIGWGFKSLIEVGHSLAENHPRQLIAFGHAVKAFDRSRLIDGQDKKEKWRERIRGLSGRMRSYDPALIPDESLIPLMRFLFPEIEKKVSSYLNNASRSS